MSPPFFDLRAGQSAKVLVPGSDGGPEDVCWVRVLHVRDDVLLGVVTSRDAHGATDELHVHDVIEFHSRHVFGLF